ncbi:MAG: replication protein [Patescibacteria group bacterium]|jgi:phage replication O-like protein O
MLTPLRTDQKNKYTRFYHDVTDNLISSKFGALEIKVILLIIRRTIGYNKEYAEISLRLFEIKIKTNHWNISKVLDRLIDNEIVIRIDGVKINKNNAVHKYAINAESFHRWHTRAGLSNTPKTGALDTPIKYKKKNLKERRNQLVDNMTFNLKND